MPELGRQTSSARPIWAADDQLGGAWLDAVNSRTDRAVPAAEQVLRHALANGDPGTVVRAQHVLALALINGGRWRLAERYIDDMLDQLSRAPHPAFTAQAWVMRAACHAERQQPDQAFEALVHAELVAEAAAEPSDQLALAFGDLAVILSEMTLYEHAERMLTRAVDTATAAGAPVAMYLFKQGRNLARWAMRLEHLGRAEQAVERYRESADALQIARDAEPDPRFSLESWVMTSVTTLCRARAALLGGEQWRPVRAQMASSRWMIKSSHSFEDAQWRVHSAASVALVTGEPRHALALLDGLLERDYAVLGPRLADRWHLVALAYEQVGDCANALIAHRKMHAWYDEDSFRNRQSRMEAARLSVAAEIVGPPPAGAVVEEPRLVDDDAITAELGAAWLAAVNSRSAEASAGAEGVRAAAAERDDAYLAMRAEHVCALAYLFDGQWTQAEPHIAALFEQLSRSPEPAYAAHAWGFHGACCAARGDTDAALESLVRAEQMALRATTPSEQLAFAYSDLAMILGEMAQYEQAELMLARSLDTAAAAGASLARHLFTRVRNLTRFAMRLEHLGRTAEAVQRYEQSLVALTAARGVPPDPRFGLEPWVMCSMHTLCRSRVALLSGTGWQPMHPQEPMPEWRAESGSSFDGVLWRAHAEASLALANDQPREAMAVMERFDEAQYGVTGPRLGDRFYLYLLTQDRLGQSAHALTASRNLHDFYDRDAYRSRRERAEAARERVARSLRDALASAGHGAVQTA